MKPVFYIAGPITGVKDYKANFANAEFALKELGAEVFNPATLPAGLPEFAYMDICLAALRHCDAVLMLQGWEASKGARVEQELAIKLNLRIIYDPRSYLALNYINAVIECHSKFGSDLRTTRYMDGGA